MQDGVTRLLVGSRLSRLMVQYYGLMVYVNMNLYFYLKWRAREKASTQVQGTHDVEVMLPDHLTAATTSRGGAQSFGPCAESIESKESIRGVPHAGHFAGLDCFNIFMSHVCINHVQLYISVAHNAALDRHIPLSNPLYIKEMECHHLPILLELLSCIQKCHVKSVEHNSAFQL